MKLLLHIGYPKTATTTLQKLLFNKLYKDNQINYVFKDNDNKELFDFIVLGKNSRKSFSENLLNVISDETLVLSSTNIEDVCKRVLSLTKDIKVVVNIRNHSNLIFSWYVQILADLKTSQIFFKEYYEVWADLLNIEVKRVKEFINKNLNEKKKKDNTYVRDFDFIYKLFRKVYQDSAKIKFKEIEFQKFDLEIKELIKNHYKEDTLMLAKKYNLSLEKLKEYSYL